MTLTQLRILFLNFFSKHKQVNHCVYGDLSDYVAIPDKLYYSINIQYNNSNVSGKYINHNYTITVSDLMKLDIPETEHSAISNCMEIAKDFIAYLSYNDDISSVNPSIQPFRQATGDITAGVVLGINVQLFLPFNECAIPTNL
ncbi:hypothetical protein [Chitinophaga sancti]|uniref:Uncharacterized protein n=1 Tax=Chitinophaga sancti TaxID=1004 RepID=A0A1K1PQH6_9BACT|nr:hypothetical protein [Chitinophaga sancti]WQD61751.1 hypothetical protein U0033_28115 [Chitinophaga sancti]WQG92691.1 hypothetical protein SR876_14325 [Chitinophaga sancti]SFW49936.1 hypothetical protein SAMN05661012_02114 [Chitinophaga sancti]